MICVALSPGLFWLARLKVRGGPGVRIIPVWKSESQIHWSGSPTFPEEALLAGTQRGKPDADSSSPRTASSPAPL